MIFRKPTSSDIQRLTEMNINLRSDEQIDNVMTFDEVKTRMESFLIDKDYVIEIIEDQDEIVGYYLLNENKNPMYLRQLFIKSEYRNRGYGRKTIDHIIKEKDIKSLDIDVMVWNTEAIMFYKRCGFKERFISMRLKL